MFLEAIPTRLMKKYKKSPKFLNSLCRANDVQKVNNNTKVIAKMLLILLENFVNIKSQRGKKLGFVKNFSPISSIK